MSNHPEFFFSNRWGRWCGDNHNSCTKPQSNHYHQPTNSCSTLTVL